MMSSFCARVGLVPVLDVSLASTIPFGAFGPLSSVRLLAPDANIAVSLLRGLSGSWLSSSAYGSNSSLFGLKRLPEASTSAIHPADDPFVQAELYGQLGPQAR